MSKNKIIPEKYINRIIEHNPYASLITTDYTNERTILNIHCKKHNINYSHTLKNAMRHNGCPECQNENILKKAYTQEEFLKKVYEKNPHIEVLGEYNKQNCHVLCRCKIHNIIFSPNSATLLHGNGGCPICAKESYSDKRRINPDDIKKIFHKINPTLTIIDDDPKLNTFVKVYCEICKNSFDKKLTSPYIHDKKCDCSVCTNKIIVSGYNDIATIRPDLIKYLVNKEDGEKYGVGSTKVLPFQCLHCGHIKEMEIEVLTRNGFSCPCCGDGISYPNKFIRSFIKQLNVKNIDFEYYSDWTNGYFYDCYFEYNNKKYIIEVDGQQHYKKSSNFKMSLEEVKSRDKEKDSLAYENNVILIRIDAQKSQKDHMVTSIKKSILSDIFDLSNINWDKCEEMATNNLAKEICIYAENTLPNNYNELRDHFQISKDTLRKYLKQGVKFGWCSRNIIERLTVPKRVNVYDKNNNFLYSFDSIKECSKEMGKIYKTKFTIQAISNNCKRITDSYKNFIFRFSYDTD